MFRKQDTNIHIALHIYICTYKYTCTYTYIHTYIHKYIHTYIHTYIHIYIYIFREIHTCVYTYIYIYIYVCLNISVYEQTDERINTYLLQLIVVDCIWVERQYMCIYIYRCVGTYLFMCRQYLCAHTQEYVYTYLRFAIRLQCLRSSVGAWDYGLGARHLCWRIGHWGHRAARLPGVGKADIRYHMSVYSLHDPVLRNVAFCPTHPKLLSFVFNPKPLLQ